MFFGLFLTIIIIEIGLRIVGFILLSIQEDNNVQSIRQKGTYCIMCLGESTTQNQYPHYLEEALNQRNIGIKFNVIDKGRAGIKTAVILLDLEANLDKYQPDMVITMMGINDGGSHVPYEAGSVSKIALTFRSFKIYKLTRLLRLHIITKFKEKAFCSSASNNQIVKRLPDRVPREEPMETYKQQRLFQQEKAFKKTIELNPNSDSAYIELGWLYKDNGKFAESEQAFKKAIELNPNSGPAYTGLGWLYKFQGKLVESEWTFKKSIELNPDSDSAYIWLGWLYKIQEKLAESEQAFKKAIELNPNSDFAYVQLGWLCRFQKKLAESEQAFKKAIELNPKNYSAYIELGWLYKDHGKLAESEQAFKKSIELNPNSDSAYMGLGWIYKAQKKLAESEQAFKKSIELNPKNYSAYIELGWLYKDHGKFAESEQAFKKNIELNPENNERLYGYLAVLYREIGNNEISEAYERKANNLINRSYNPETVNNYRMLKQILDKRKIKLICVQYPMRNLEPLKKIFEEEMTGSFVFVDNAKIFKDAIRKKGYNKYFVDMFGGDFGHCTPKGNELLAENIANVILKEVFGK